MHWKETSENLKIKTTFFYIILTSSKLLLSTTLTINSDGPINAILLPSGLTDKACGPRLSPLATVFARSRSRGKLSAVAS